MTPRFNHTKQAGSGDSVHISTTLENIALTTLSGYDGEDLRDGIEEAKRMNQDAIIAALAGAFYKPTGIEQLVCNDITARQQLGILKYGRTVAESSDDMLQHAYEESLDLCVYLKAEITKRTKP
jgi:hypothetical protein